VERVTVIGNSGGGKSQLARQLAAQSDLPYVEIDTLLWRAGWRLASDEEFDAAHAQHIGKDRWVIDGVGKRASISARLDRATDIVLVDLPLWLHFALAAERQLAWAAGRLEHPLAGMTEMPPLRALFRTIWDIDRDWLPEIRRLIEAEEAQGKRVFRLTSLEALDGFLPSLML
jgi:adenylate kinase family enzyme